MEYLVVLGKKFCLLGLRLVDGGSASGRETYGVTHGASEADLAS